VFESDRLVIRLMEEKDIEEARQLHNEESTLNRLTDPFHVSQEEQQLWFKRMSTSRKSRRYVLEHKESGKICGIIRLDEIDTVNRSASIGADVNPSFRNQGYATEISIDFAFVSHRISIASKIAFKLAAAAFFTKRSPCSPFCIANKTKETDSSKVIIKRVMDQLLLLPSWKLIRI